MTASVTLTRFIAKESCACEDASGSRKGDCDRGSSTGPVGLAEVEGKDIANVLRRPMASSLNADARHPCLDDTDAGILDVLWAGAQEQRRRV